jgi:glutamate-ammonia-ligase adenylyltransferase
LTRDLRGYGAYFERWAETWERQALARARIVAGDRTLGERFMALVDDFVWGRPLTDSDVAAIRRMKARIERERIPSREDPQFHLKLGRGSLSDIEWTVQLLQLRHRIPEASTHSALEILGDRGVLARADQAALQDAYRFCERTRNRWHLVGALPGGGSPGDALPTQADQLSHLARSLGTTPSLLRDDYRRVTRRARRVVERVFYGIEDA